MATDHESKLFIVQTVFRSGGDRLDVFRTRAAARRYVATQNAKRTVHFCTVLPAKWGPDA